MEDRFCTVTIDPKGQGISVDLEGFHGVGCKALADAFKTVGPIKVDTDKPEIYDNCNQNVLTTRV